MAANDVERKLNIVLHRDIINSTLHRDFQIPIIKNEIAKKYETKLEDHLNYLAMNLFDNRTAVRERLNRTHPTDLFSFISTYFCQHADFMIIMRTRFKHIILKTNFKILHLTNTLHTPFILLKYLRYKTLYLKYFNKMNKFRHFVRTFKLCILTDDDY